MRVPTDFFAPEFKALGGGDPGNHVVIDHGQGEFSMIAHFMAGSMLVKDGARVRQGQALGKLGHSGDTNAPHVHCQLQAGPDWQNADALPVHFGNVDQEFLDRGTYFEARTKG
jgi:murein DD-endopeptidase MepM/ murein hydrolase activator NlpD